jgi:hypothetical protein
MSGQAHLFTCLDSANTIAPERMKKTKKPIGKLQTFSLALD